MSLSTPIPGRDDDVRRGHRRYYFIWYRPAEGERLRDLLTDAAGRYQGYAIPPPLIRPDHIAAMKADAARLLPPVIAGIVAKAQPLLQAVSDLEVPRLAFGRAVLLGDAAFIARPHVARASARRRSTPSHWPRRWRPRATSSGRWPATSTSGSPSAGRWSPIRAIWAPPRWRPRASATPSG